MGYRSDVALAVAPQAASAFMAMLAEHPKAMALCNDADTFMSGYEQEGDWFVFWSDIKWYDSYEEIDSIQSFVHALDNNDLTDYGEPTCPGEDKAGQWHEYFKFICIGESTQDTEVLGWGFPSLSIQRSIIF